VVEDALSVIKAAAVCLDSADDWQVVLPLDGVFDNQREELNFTVKVEKPGPHLLTLRVEDVMGNVAYRNVRVEVK
jgi:hypothetical protein